ncbi:MAG: phosphoribosylformylglycinamidine synthase, partial [Oscillospiraceae bacterium]
MSVYRIYVEKKPQYAVEAKGILSEVHTFLGINGLTNVRLLNRYDVEGISEDVFDACKKTVFSEPQLDDIYEHIPDKTCTVFATEYLPGQFDQRADSCAQCIQIVSRGDRPTVRTATIYLLYGNFTANQLDEIKKYLINPVEKREASANRLETLKTEYNIPTEVATLDGFCEKSEAELADFVRDNGLAMD